MAIEFDCPYCTAMIRVGDDAAGKQGVCPKCSTSLIVPRPQSESATAAPTASDIVPDVVPDVVPEFRSRPSASVSSRVRRRRRSRGGLAFPLACGGVLLLVITVAWFLNDPSRYRGALEGELRGSVVGAEMLGGVEIDGELISGRGEAYTALVASLKERPGRVRSNVMIVEFVESQGRMQVRVEPAREFQLVRVSLGQTESLKSFLESQSSRLESLRREDLAGSLGRLLSDWESAREGDLAFEGWTGYRGSVGLTALVGGLGHHLVARTGRQELPCLYESDRAVFFLVPESLVEFQLVGRRRPDGSVPFPAEFTVRIGHGS